MSNRLRSAMAAAGYGGEKLYIEDVFSTYLYTGNGSTQTINNGIDLSTKGGMVWLKSRSAATDHALYDTARGATFDLVSNSTAAQTTQATGLTAFGSTGFSIGALAKINTNAATYASWTFREQAKFFDVVTYTGTGANRTIAHNLGSVPGMIIVKRTDFPADWQVYHRSLENTEYMVLNSTSIKQTSTTLWNSTTPTSSVFSLGTAAAVNGSGGTYVAYLFAHDAGGFGASGTDNVISCGIYTGNGSASGSTVTLGYEPQYVLIKTSGNIYSGDWMMFDSMRGIPTGGNDPTLLANTSGAEDSAYGPINMLDLTATGFVAKNANYTNITGEYYIYIAIRRGPMKTPTDPTKVFSPVTYDGNSITGTNIQSGFVADLAFGRKPGTVDNPFWIDRLRGGDLYLNSSNDNAEAAGANASYATQNGILLGNVWNNNNTPRKYVLEFFQRAPGFFDEVCWTGNNGSNQRVSHNLGVVPELIIYKGRNKVNLWRVYFGSINTYIQLDAGIAAVSFSNSWGSSAPTTTDFGINCGLMDLDNFNAVAYLFASVPGVSKVGSYTGTGAAQTINCGFAAGARFVLIKRTDSTGDWYTWDSARGIIAGNDPYLLMNSTAAEVTNTDYIDPVSSGFEISSTAPVAINANGGSYIFLAIA